MLRVIRAETIIMKEITTMNKDRNITAAKAKAQAQNAEMEKMELNEQELEKVNGGLWNIFLPRELLNR